MTMSSISTMIIRIRKKQIWAGLFKARLRVSENFDFSFATFRRGFLFVLFGILFLI